MSVEAMQSLTTQGFVDALDGLVLSGWAANMDTPGQPASLLLVVDDHPVAMFECSEPRPDVNALGFPGLKLGYRFELPEHLLDGGEHRISIRFRGGPALRHTLGTGAYSDEITFRYHPTTVKGMVDGIFGASIRGWAVRTDSRSGEKTGGVTIEVRANGAKLGQVSASLIRNDVAEAFGCEPHCGFLYTLPPRFRDSKPFVLEFHAAPEGGQLDGSPFAGAVLERTSTDQLHAMHAKVEALCSQMYALKDQLRQMLTADEHTVDRYHAWAVAYHETLRARMADERRTPEFTSLFAGRDPKVSVLCPAYRPGLADFAAAVESVRRQSWRNWELIIVDDGSGSAALTEVIDGFVAADPRIRAVPHASNQGISAATNTAVAAATGDWIALFDHDDLLVDVALEVMLAAALNTGARLLYSDEDKIDAAGYFSEPHLKTDWNYRLLLTNNYVCHLLLADAAVLREAGPLDPSYDGAQDHDLLLRVSEAAGGRSRIHHVPELLYHWRLTAGLDRRRPVGNKDYAARGRARRAVLDHLGPAGGGRRSGHGLPHEPRPSTTFAGVSPAHRPARRVRGDPVHASRWPSRGAAWRASWWRPSTRGCEVRAGRQLVDRPRNGGLAGRPRRRGARPGGADRGAVQLRPPSTTSPPAGSTPTCCCS